MTNILYKKEYGMNALGSLFLRNYEPAMEYVNTVVDDLINAENPDRKRDIKLKFLSDFKEIYEYDCVNADRPEMFGTFESDEEKEALIKTKQLFDDVILYLGHVFLAYHKHLIQSNTFPILDRISSIIDFNECYKTAISEYVRVIKGIDHPVRITFSAEYEENLQRQKQAKQLAWSSEIKTVEYRGVEARITVPIPNATVLDPLHACATSFIMPSLIEHGIVMRLENSLIYEWADKMSELINADTDSITDEEKDRVHQFNELRLHGHGTLNGSKSSNLKFIWESAVRHGIFSTSDSDKKQILNGKRNSSSFTLGSIFYSEYAKSKIKPEYCDLLSCLFDTKNLNIRNNIMHGNYETYDYLAIEIAAIMVQIFLDVASGDLFAE